MSLKLTTGWLRGLLGLVVATVSTVAAIHALSQEPEIALMIGEPWETMRQRSSASIEPAVAGHFWGRSPGSDARLRLLDHQHGFVTPLARFFSVSFNKDERVASVRMSPQVEPLSLDDTLEVVLDLQEQLRRGNWTPVWVDDFPSFADTPQWRARLQDGYKVSKAYWRVENKYQVMLVVSHFKDDKPPLDKRYLITLALARPWGGS